MLAHLSHHWTRTHTLGKAAAIAAVVTAGLAASRLFIQREEPAVGLVLAATALGFVLSASRIHRDVGGPMCRCSLPLVGLLGVTTMAFVDGGLYSESLFWLPFVPMIAVIASRRTAVFCVFATFVPMAVLLVLHLIGTMPRLPGDGAGAIFLRWFGLMGAVGFGLMIAYFYDQAQTRALATIREDKHQLQAVLDQLDTGVAISSRRGRVVALNDELRRLFDITAPADDFLGTTIEDLIRSAAKRPQDQGAVFQKLSVLRSENRSESGQMPVSTGQIYEYSHLPIDLGGGTPGHLWSFRDITLSMRKHSDMLTLLRTDAVSQVASRGYFIEMLEESCESRVPFALLFLDLDRFKEINDTHGHMAGDKVLRAIGDGLRACVRTADVVGRFGGDEFAVLARHISTREQAAALAKKLIDVVAGAVPLGETRVSVGVSIGIALYPGTTTDAGTLLQAADGAMYQAKRAGGNRFQVARPSLSLTRLA